MMENDEVITKLRKFISMAQEGIDKIRFSDSMAIMAKISNKWFSRKHRFFKVAILWLIKIFAKETLKALRPNYGIDARKFDNVVGRIP